MEVAMRRFLIGLVASLLALLPAMAAEQGPDGTIELSGGSVAVGIGYTWGSGKLVYQGKQYQLKVEGISIADVAFRITRPRAASTISRKWKISKEPTRRLPPELPWQAA